MIEMRRSRQTFTIALISLSRNDRTGGIRGTCDDDTVRRFHGGETCRSELKSGSGPAGDLDGNQISACIVLRYAT
jgi:hypothetical protein